ncbi:hypothetical protein C8C83_2508 [Flavobacterium sp. 90]|uniref:hypothetical protein n=1 Tax=unclassified Flavobacterium TaxID=196869 RepID=UPI000EB0EFD4|nr:MULTISPECIES: hypothetical protein [unclassified Flavobacterium]RKR10818.1 hypothetical protein C8C82_2814 [Flavobacterium sp. 81]TCK54601.1 hypothetical protein C8C83_2508 [Flavobacterium sp. 90]
MKTQNIDWSYLFKQWIFSLIIGPVISQIIAFIPVFYPSQAIGLLGMFPVVFIVSLIFSAPTYIVYAFVYNFLAKKDFPILYSKAFLITIPVIGVFITTAFIGGMLWYFIAVSYSLSSIICGLLFNLNFYEEEEL